nr:MAG TPA: hypothetical protein [Caudoviricetes sp.]
MGDLLLPIIFDLDNFPNLYIIYLYRQIIFV